MGKGLVEVDKRQIKAVKKFAKELIKRARAVKKFVTHRVAMSALEDIKGSAPTDIEYAKYLEVLRVTGAQNIGYVIAYLGKGEELDEKDPATTVYYFKPMKRKMNKMAGVANVLKKYGPFAKDMLPIDIDSKNMIVIYRDVSTREVEKIRIRNRNEAKGLRLDLAKVGAKMKPESTDESKGREFEVFSDLAFKVLRREYGIEAKSTPHWRPAIRRVMSGQGMMEIMKSPMVYKSLTDPTYPGWKRMGMIGSTIAPGELKALNDFQEMILNK